MIESNRQRVALGQPHFQHAELIEISRQQSVLRGKAMRAKINGPKANHQPHQQLVVRNFEVPCSSVDEIVLHPRSIGTWDTWQRRIHNDLKEVLRNLPRDENVICQAISLRNDEQLCWRGGRICTPFYLT